MPTMIAHGMSIRHEMRERENKGRTGGVRVGIQFVHRMRYKVLA